MRTRKYFLDWLRVVAFALLILFHVGALYATWDYNLKSPRIVPAIEWLLLTFSPWRMALLFLISGVASRFLIDKLGPGGFVRDRLRRLVPVILVGMFVVIPPQTWIELVSKGVTHASYIDFWLFSYLPAKQTLVAPLGKTMPTWDHLWFVVYLLCYTLGLALVLRFRRKSPPRRSTVPAAVLLTVPAGLLIVANLLIEHLAPLTHALVNDWGGHLKWIPLFAAGVVFASRDDLWVWLRERRGTLLALAGVGLALQTICHAYWLTGRMDQFWDGVLWSISTSLYAWAAISAVTGYAARYLDRASAMLAHLNEAILPVYVLHQPILLFAAYLVFPLQLPLAVEFVVILAMTAVGAFALYEVLIRPFDVMRLLFGLKTGQVPMSATSA